MPSFSSLATLAMRESSRRKRASCRAQFAGSIRGERSRVGSRRRDVFGDHGFRRNNNIIANLDMTNGTRMSRQQTAFADLRAAGNRDRRCHRRMLTNMDVVPDHTQVINAHTVPNHRIVERTAVDRRIRTNFDVVANEYAAVLGHFDPAFGRHSIAETIGADHDAGMQNAALARCALCARALRLRPAYSRRRRCSRAQ